MWMCLWAERLKMSICMNTDIITSMNITMNTDTAMNIITNTNIITQA